MKRFKKSLLHCGRWQMLRVSRPLIAANDMRARLYSAWFAEMGISVPRDLSLIGFDNDMTSQCYSISTVDFGLGAVGYQAAHIFIGDIPIRIGRDRRLLGEPRFMERGSVTGPRIGELKIAP